MKIAKRAVIAVGVLMLSLVGCGPVEGEELPPSELIPPEQIGLIPDGAQLSPEMIAAVLAQVPKPTDQMLQPAAACVSTKTCTNLGYGSCGSWSTYTSCGSITTCNPTDTACKSCAYDPDIGSVVCDYLGGQNTFKNRYRVCFNSAGSPCTEWELVTTKVCGCGGP